MNKHIIDRSNLDAVVSYNLSTKTRKTLRDELALDKMHLRADIVLINGLRTGNQYCVYVSDSGFQGDTFVLDFLTEDEFNKVNEIADRMRRNAIDYPPAQRLLVR